MPVAYLTACYALVMRGGMVKQSKVLIHSGTGAVVLAAIQICLQRGAEVGDWLPLCCGYARTRRLSAAVISAGGKNISSVSFEVLTSSKMDRALTI